MSLIVTPFGPRSTAMEVVAGVDLSGRAAIVTGASSGIGLETVRALATTGARVVLAVRDVEAGGRAAEEIAASVEGACLEVRELDLADVRSVDRFVAGWDGPLRLLVNNAGVMESPLRRTPQGWELQFATNHLGHFALAVGLHDALAADGAARIVSLSSSGHGASPVHFEDLFFERRPYDPSLAYGQSKTANVLFAVEASRRWAPDGIAANAVMPGGIWTRLQRHWGEERLRATRAAVA